MSSQRERFESRRVGGVRPSQLIHTYGPGAVVDLPGMSVVVAGIGDWDLAQTERIREPRLIGAVRAIPGCSQVSEFRTPPWENETASAMDYWARVGIPVHPFPRWLRCTRCDLLAPVDQRRFTLYVPHYRPDRARYFHNNCHGYKPSAVPARFMVACPHGHLDDFPWVEYVHRGDRCPGGGAAILELKEVGMANRATDVRVVCKTCGSDRMVQDAFGLKDWEHLPRCRGRHPHLQRFDPVCNQPTRALLLGASNSWFAVSRSALTIPTETERIDQKVEEFWDDLEDIDNRYEFDVIVRRLERGRGEQQLRWLLHFDRDDVWTAITDRRDDHGVSDGADHAHSDLRGPEWAAMTSPVPVESDHFKVRHLRVPNGFAKTLDSPVAVDRLREVIALCGFTRIDGPGDVSSVERFAPIWAEPSNWLPSAETLGEGILIRLPEARVEQWEEEFEASGRYRELAAAHQAWRRRRGLNPQAGIQRGRFVLVHTLAHMLIHQVALDSGYSTASIRERLYCRTTDDSQGEPMAGVLLYTASPDSEGTLGGLVALADPARLSATLREALRRGRLCSTDPMCADHHAGEQSDALHAAACHACLFAPETSCEHGNRYLDRATVVPILSDPVRSYFQ